MFWIELCYCIFSLQKKLAFQKNKPKHQRLPRAESSSPTKCPIKEQFYSVCSLLDNPQ